MAVEYAALLALVVVVCVTATGLHGANASRTFNKAASTVGP
jgi:Flp pilus assembly pilin Flp